MFKFEDKTQKEYEDIAETLASAMYDKVLYEGILTDVVTYYSIEKLMKIVGIKFVVKLLSDFKLHAHNCGKFNEEELKLVDLCDTILNSIINGDENGNEDC